MKETRANFRNQGASIHNLEYQVWDISKLLVEITQGALSSNTGTNPKGKLKKWKRVGAPKENWATTYIRCSTEQ